MNVSSLGMCQRYLPAAESMFEEESGDSSSEDLELMNNGLEDTQRFFFHLNRCFQEITGNESPRHLELLNQHPNRFGLNESFPEGAQPELTPLQEYNIVVLIYSKNAIEEFGGMEVSVEKAAILASAQKVRQTLIRVFNDIKEDNSQLKKDLRAFDAAFHAYIPLAARFDEIGEEALMKSIERFGDAAEKLQAASSLWLAGIHFQEELREMEGEIMGIVEQRNNLMSQFEDIEKNGGNADAILVEIQQLVSLATEKFHEKEAFLQKHHAQLMSSMNSQDKDNI